MRATLAHRGLYRVEEYYPNHGETAGKYAEDAMESGMTWGHRSPVLYCAFESLKGASGFL